MKFFNSLTLMVSLVSATPVLLSKRGQPLTIELARDGNTGIKATLTNSGNSTLKLFTPGTILDSSAVEKVAVFSNNSRVPFEGVRLRMAPQEFITDASFRTVRAGEVINIDIDFARLHDVSKGGNYDVLVNAHIPYAKGNSTELDGTYALVSNKLHIQNVDAANATLTRINFNNKIKRTAVQADCKGTQLATVTTALGNCVKLARAAADATKKNDKRMNEYFKNSTAAAKTIVADTFNKVVTECTKGKSSSKQYCTDVYTSCVPGVLAYTVPVFNYMVNCPLYFTALTDLATTCHGQDRATTTLHEMTHLVQVKGTLDYGVYGYDAVKALKSAENLNHADTYCLFANAINLGTSC